MYIFDSREKKNEHIKRYFDRHGIEYKIEKLDVGDYRLVGNDQVVVDRKQNLDECLQNLMLKRDKPRFMREVRRAMDTNVKLVILCENGGDIKSIEDVEHWKSAYSRVPGKAIANRMRVLERSFDIEFKFCDKRHTAKEIISILEETT